ncbi:Two-component response regulator ARR18 [Platanthera guangdongensis]|uniref:Two-component response regulator ARR18 n=1 Tax=Platanthera guangdongensis TaxID=2320717 RepID=A0ABR2MF92_9ASPA
MVSAQLWSKTRTGNAGSKESDQEQSLMPLSSKLVLDARPRVGGAFHPFSKDEQRIDLPQLALASNEKEMEEKESCSKSSGGEEQQCRGGINCSVSGDCTAPAAQRKARRCWSPDLHRRFVNALQRLGGSQCMSEKSPNFVGVTHVDNTATAATPKQIRELMKVDGLTNDEVKSHLQVLWLSLSLPAAASCGFGGHLGPTRLCHISTNGGGTGARTVRRPPLVRAVLPYSAAASLDGWRPASLPPTIADPCRRQQVDFVGIRGLRGSPASEFRSSGDRSESMEEEEEEEEEVVAGGGQSRRRRRRGEVLRMCFFCLRVFRF